VDACALREIGATAPREASPPVCASDTSVWARCDADCRPERGYYHHPARQSAGQPIVAGWSYCWLAQLSFSHDSWTAPLDVRRVRPPSNAHTMVAEDRPLRGSLPIAPTIAASVRVDRPALSWHHDFRSHPADNVNG